ncbi:hypothetical protein Dred_2566 [Desulforamulus reducens MI-1]|uniref:PDGLE domain-containing protein n=1 Tax=Desulforamulus reducens (strain ATCC BAA-1160 / DSM 100696 / MI-1) TaxID=349161 RepID=A4J7M3_DESRM|nr:PDGLE domain-containing protein [Desulforamulus reducens]ABO51076.1 hypothetical protein Dred_2566 [Desulforamulus reducens MI-1]
MTRKLFLGLLASLLVAALLSPFASPHPDGLERVAEDKNFLVKAEGKEVLSSPIPDYVMPGIGNESLATGVAGVTGVLLTFGFMMGMKKLLIHKQNPSA